VLCFRSYVVHRISYRDQPTWALGLGFVVGCWRWLLCRLMRGLTEVQGRVVAKRPQRVAGSARNNYAAFTIARRWRGPLAGIL
jgi:hypothetical protein